MSAKKKIGVGVLIVAVLTLSGYWIGNRVYMSQRPYVAAGTLEAVEVDVASLVPGRVSEVMCDEGDTVKAGQLVAKLQAEEISAAADAARAGVEAARSRVAAARASLKAAEDEYNRITRAFPAGGISEGERSRVRAKLDAARADYASAVASLSQTEALVAEAEARTREVEVFSPLNGIVLSRNFEPGEVVGAGAPLVTVADLKELEAYVYLPEDKLNLVRVGDDVYIHVDACPGRSFPGKVKAIASKAEFTPRNIEAKEDRVTLVFKIIVSVKNAMGDLKPGMPADVVFIKTRGSKRIK